MAELAAEISTQTGRDISYRDLPVEQYTQALISAGLPQPTAAVIADSDRGLARGELFVGSGHLRQLTGRPSTTLHEAIAAALAAIS